MKHFRLWMSTFAAILAVLFLTQCSMPLGQLDSDPSALSRAGTAATGFTANAMAELNYDNVEVLNTQLDTAKAMGIDAISVDVWWGRVETSDNNFNWSYYDTLFDKIKSKGLKIVPILSFHQCGNSFGGTGFNQPLPAFVWTKYQGKSLNGVTINVESDLQYKSEEGRYSDEAIAVWADPLVANEYADFASAFRSQYQSKFANDFQEINISMGTSGELRYPSYDGSPRNGYGNSAYFGWPNRGALQAYSALAVKDLQNKIMAKYGSLSAVNTAWGTSLTQTSQIQPPSNAGSFFDNKDYLNTQYGKDFVDWYNQSLVDHGATMLNTIIPKFDGAFPGTKIGYKIAGVHWKMNTSYQPRSAELAAGLIQTSVDYNAESTGHGYNKVINLANTASNGRTVVLHFTCLEKDNSGESLAKDLVFWIANRAKALGVQIKGENADQNAMAGDEAWNWVDNALKYASYSGYTNLRLSNVVNGGIPQSRYTALITKYRIQDGGWPTLYLRGTHNNWTTSVPMTKSNGVWTASNVTFGSASGQGFKFDVYGDWTKNYGAGTVANVAVLGGGNIAVGAGTYNISIEEATLAYSVNPVSVNYYDISGTISGAVVSGVNVSAGGKSATSDANGNYTISDLPSSTTPYTVAASLSGYNFAPASQSVSLSGGDATGINFSSSVATGLIVHYTEFQSATSYGLHAWNGLSGDYTMSYEGFINNAHWWKVTLSNAPASFLFCFYNSNGKWDGVNRSYTGQASEIYVKNGSATVYTSRP